MRWSEIVTESNESINPQWVVPVGVKAAVERGEYTVVNVNVADVDTAWSKNASSYISGPESPNIFKRGNSDRYTLFGEFFKTGKPVEMSEIYLDHFNELNFSNGRHRFSWMRDHGVKSLPVVVPAEQAELFKQKFGS